jgi:hypothetical protein
MIALLARAWARWKVIAHVIGTFQARLLLSLFYVLVVPPFALILKRLKDPLMLRPSQAGGLWVERPRAARSLATARRPF